MILGMTEHTNADRLAGAVARLVADGTLTPDQAERVTAQLRPLFTPQATAAPKTRGLLVEFAGYLGGALLLGGVSLVVVPTWDNLPFGARLALAAVVTVLLAVGAVVIGRPGRRDAEAPDASERLASTLAALAAGGAATTAAVLAADNLEPLLGSIAALVVTVVAYPLLRGAPLLVATCAASAMTVGSVLDRANVDSQTGWATAFALLGAGWLALGITGVVRERGTAGLLGGVIGLGAGETASVVDADSVALYGLALGVLFIAACFGAYLASHRWPLLVPAVLTALIVPPTALANALESGLAAGVAVAAVGALILAAGGVTLIVRPGPSRA